VSTGKLTETEIFSSNLRTLRGGRKKRVFAEFLGTSPQNYGRYEGGRIPKPVILKEIANRCGVTVDWLIGQEAPEPRRDNAVREGSPAHGAVPDPGDRLASLEETVEAIRQDVASCRSQMETLLGLLGEALGRGLDTKRKAG